MGVGETAGGGVAGLLVDGTDAKGEAPDETTLANGDAVDENAEKDCTALRASPYVSGYDAETY